jgi:hypothetical protein
VAGEDLLRLGEIESPCERVADIPERSGDGGGGRGIAGYNMVSRLFVATGVDLE